MQAFFSDFFGFFSESPLTVFKDANSAAVGADGVDVHGVAADHEVGVDHGIVDAQLAALLQGPVVVVGQAVHEAHAHGQMADGGYYGYGPFGGGYYQQRTGYNQKYDDSHLQAAYNYILYRRYREALNVLAQFGGVRGAEYYYLSALANQGVGNQVTALEHMRKAVSMDPGNQEYLSALDRMEHGGDAYRRQAGNFQGFDLKMNPCTSLCLCMMCNQICPGAWCFFPFC